MRKRTGLPGQIVSFLFLSVVLSLFTQLGCASGASGSVDDPGRFGDGGAASRCYGANDCAPGQICNSFGVCSFSASDMGQLGDGLAPEVAVELDPPASGQRYVYVAVPAEDAVVRIDALSLAVETIAVGAHPAALRTAPGRDLAVVLNRGDDTATILRATADGGDEVVTLPIAPGLNRLTVAPDGLHAVAWFDLDDSGGLLTANQSLQDVTVLTLEDAREAAVTISVGFRPRSVQFDQASDAAYVVTDQGVSVVGLRGTIGGAIAPTVPLVRDPLVELPPDGVRITADGKLALCHQTGLHALRAVDLGTRVITDVALAAEPTDIAITPDGALALAVLRDAGSVAFVPLPAGLVDPAQIASVSTGAHTAGQAAITADGTQALLFSNAAAQKVVLVADLAARTLLARPLSKSVRTVALAPDGRTAVIVHSKAPGTPSTSDALDEYLAKLEGYSLFDLSTGYAKLQPTPAAPGHLAFAPDSSAAYILIADAGNTVRLAQALDLQSFLVTSLMLGSPPVAVGVVPMTAAAYIAQAHPLGRITFIDPVTLHARTLTGFSLNGGIIE